MLELIDANQVGPVFVAHREVEQEIFNGDFASVGHPYSSGDSLGDLLGGLAGYSRNVVKVKLVKRGGGFEQINSWSPGPVAPLREALAWQRQSNADFRSAMNTESRNGIF
jgi:hypothetical protein